MVNTHIDRFFVQEATTVRDVMACIDRNARGVALVVDDDQRLTSTITDGDIRRAILAGTGLDEPISTIIAGKAGTSYAKPITAREGTPRKVLLNLMQKRVVLHIPLVDDDGHVVELVTADELMPKDSLPLQAVVMAGGYGQRLRPLTENIPKPMLPVGGRPVLEHIIDGLRDSGIKQVSITTHYKPDVIRNHFGNGESFGVELNYAAEEQPLGTAGALGQMEFNEQPLLVMNGDLLTNVDFRAMLMFHREHDAALTVGVRQYDLEVPYGVLESDGVYVRSVREKPTYNFFVNAGIYLLEPSAHQYIPKGERFDMTDLIERLIENNERVLSFPIVEYWLDIGRPEDYEQAQSYVPARRARTRMRARRSGT